MWQILEKVDILFSIITLAISCGVYLRVRHQMKMAAIETARLDEPIRVKVISPDGEAMILKDVVLRRDLTRAEVQGHLGNAFGPGRYDVPALTTGVVSRKVVEVKTSQKSLVEVLVPQEYFDTVKSRQ